MGLNTTRTPPSSNISTPVEVSVPIEGNLSNPQDRPWIVQKFGGTSVGKFLDAIANDIVRQYVKNNRVVVVCSARSGDSKATGTTNRLLRAAEEALKPDSNLYIDIVKEITEDHLVAARESIQDAEILAELEQQITHDCSKLQKFLQAAEIIEEVSPRSRDLIMSVGEKLSCRIVAAVLRDKGVNSQYVCLDNIIEQRFDLLNQSFYNYVGKQIAEAIRNCGDKIPVVTGFFGSVPGSLLTTIGRGYTDLCAALAAVGLHAEELQIWKEVDGIFTADPRKVTSARLIPVITPEEASELTYYGAEVIHPFTMEQVIRANIPIRIKNVENPTGHGTVIFPETFFTQNGASEMPPSPAPSGTATPTKSPPQLDLTERHPTAVTIKDNVVVLNVHSNRKNVSHGFLAKIFTILDKYGIVVDLISTSEVHISMALGAESVETDLRKAMDELELLGTVDLSKNMAILSLVGRYMRHMVGISGRMFSTLAAANINIEMISQGANEINISCVIEEKKAVRALRAIHDELLSIPDKYDVVGGKVVVMNF
ncbi:hypothetical protein BZG36_01837 [Bifiguratus adelaidae]|uniref:Aspartokinase n=1 Tax=Bifiguratus adelaidae TaxID=1938954 RepID=A0A261Y2A2_9FUNG|nr:hypothetical protein BZG36_01837 [Bifiguratus adelaidae]